MWAVQPYTGMDSVPAVVVGCVLLAGVFFMLLFRVVRADEAIINRDEGVTDAYRVDGNLGSGVLVSNRTGQRRGPGGHG